MYLKYKDIQYMREYYFVQYIDSCSTVPTRVNITFAKHESKFLCHL